ncbi:MAG: hypothetical protein PHH40_00110 [Candidatus Moranbacteria bacterium]|nr:hypothetical protein [Candidatus Moranbacteria bacterium]MDD3965273.1 hypothetical protein [Candidatus Moranbacteria bacterium]
MIYKILIAVLVILLLVGGFFSYQRFSQRDVPTETLAPVVIEKTPSIKKVVPPKKDPEDTLALFGVANYESENFRVGDIAIGGESEFLLSEDTPDPLTITEIRGEAFTEKNKPEVKLVITWKTNKLAKSNIAYSKGVGQPKKTVNEVDYTTNHSLILPGLDQSSTYLYTIVSDDRFGNTATSDQHAIYTGSKSVSLFDLIAGAVGDVFGWAAPK